jgi:hypothetical protein
MAHKANQELKNEDLYSDSDSIIDFSFLLIANTRSGYA